jgi:plasmid stabilization system protein ParE
MISRKLRVHSEAQVEIEEAFERYRQESPLTADRFLAEIGLSLKRIATNPKLYPSYTKNTRRRVLGSFPFSVVYREKEDIILIVAIAHAKRREGYWKKRT